VLPAIPCGLPITATIRISVSFHSRAGPHYNAPPGAYNYE
jgi:hypothetical protein